MLGPNGAGKTTLMRMMVGMIRMTEGEVWIDGQSVKQQFESTASKIGAVIETPEFYPFLSGYENLTYFGRMNGNVTEERIDEVVKLLGMGQVIDRKVKAYSLGMRQRLGIAQALIHDPDVLILDEPTNGLDPSGIHEMRMYIKKIAHEQGKAVLVSSHLLSEVELMCDRVIIIQHGEYVATQNIQHNQSEEMETIRIRVDDANKAAEMLDQDVLIKGNDLLIHVKDEEIPNVIRTLLEKTFKCIVYMKKENVRRAILELTGEKILFNLVYNELYKIFKRKRTIIPFAVIAVLIIGLGWVTVKYLEPETKGWKADYTERTVEIEKKLGMEKEAILAERSGDELVKEYQLKMKHLDTDTAPASSSPLSFMRDTGFIVFPILLPFILVYASTIFANEYSWGTYKFLTIRPASRFKILTAKFLAIVIFAALLFIFNMIFPFYVGLLFINSSSLHGANLFSKMEIL